MELLPPGSDSALEQNIKFGEKALEWIDYHQSLRAADLSSVDWIDAAKMEQCVNQNYT